MKSFNESFYTEYFDQEMLDFIKANYNVGEINGWYPRTTLRYHINDNDFYVSSFRFSSEGDTLTKDEFKRKIGMPTKGTIMENETVQEQVTFVKKDLVDGMFVKVRDQFYMVLCQVLCSYDRYIPLEDFDEPEWNITEVFVTDGEDGIAPLNHFLNGEGLVPIWKRTPPKSEKVIKLEERISIMQDSLLALKEQLEEELTL